jgi:hypothetical protein
MFDFSEVFCGYTKPQVVLNCFCLVAEICIFNFEVHRTAIFVEKSATSCVKVQRTIIFVILRCAAPSKRGKFIFATNITVRCTFLLNIIAVRCTFLLNIIAVRCTFWVNIITSICPFPSTEQYICGDFT